MCGRFVQSLTAVEYLEEAEEILHHEQPVGSVKSEEAGLLEPQP